MKEYGLDSTFEYYLFEGMAPSSKTGRPERAEPGLPITTAPWSDPSPSTTRTTDGQAPVAPGPSGIPGLGLGRRLMDEVMEFCRLNLYRRIYLWTFSELREARTSTNCTGSPPPRKRSMSSGEGKSPKNGGTTCSSTRRKRKPRLAKGRLFHPAYQEPKPLSFNERRMRRAPWASAFEKPSPSPPESGST